MIQNYIENANFEDTGFAYTLSLISGKHKMVILYCLMEFKTVRFNEQIISSHQCLRTLIRANTRVQDIRWMSALHRP